MFEMADDDWRGKPITMSMDTVAVVADGIADHVRRYDLPDVQVVLHGGEPLLAGRDYIDGVASALRNAIDTAIDLRVQTNGTLLSDPMLDVLARNDIRVGVSLDGNRQANDRHRRYASGQGSYDAVARSLRRLRERAPHLLAGILCTVDLRNDPVETYEALQEFEPPVVDFLLPHGNWDTPPPGRDPVAADAPYGVWLSAVFDYWYATSPQRCQVRMFSEIIHVMLGGQAAVETVGLAPVSLITINSDGALEQVDTLRSAYAGAVGIGLNVHTHGLDEAITHPAIIARQQGRDGLSETCQKCSLHRVCGGGLYTHRYSVGNGFMNPSIYCRDLSYLIRHIHRRVSHDVARLRAGGT
jgi:uncharacterized protein